MTKSSKEIIETLYDELERRDKQIDRLKEENMLLMKTAVKAEERVRKLEAVLKEKKTI